MRRDGGVDDTPTNPSCRRDIGTRGVGHLFPGLLSDMTPSSLRTTYEVVEVTVGLGRGLVSVRKQMSYSPLLSVSDGTEESSELLLSVSSSCAPRLLPMFCTDPGTGVTYVLVLGQVDLRIRIRETETL